MHIRLDECTSPEVENVLRDKSRVSGVILPIGCIEQHGPALPLGCDMRIARGVAEGLATTLTSSVRYQGFVLPDFAYTPSPGAEHTPGTVSVSFDWMGRGLAEVFSAALRTPWAFGIIVNGHAHNHGRVIETSIAGTSGVLGRILPIIVINVYSFTSLCQKHNLVPGSHGGEFEIALNAYYGGKNSGRNFWTAYPPKPRPPGIYGLSIMPRSNHGIIAPATPNFSNALAAAEALGSELQTTIGDYAIANLDGYFRHWL